MDITVNVTSSLTNSQRRISPNWSLAHLRQRLEAITGIPPQHQQLVLYPLAISSECVELEGEDTKPVSSFNVPEGGRIQVNDVRPDSELLALEDNDSTTVEGYEMDDEEYDRRTNTVRHWKRENKLGQYDPEYAAKRQQTLEKNEASASALRVGSRFRTVGEQNERRGVIRYLGKVPEIDNTRWCGVEFDEPLGKNDGSVKGVYYFQAKNNYGGFLRAQQIEQGDFPELGLFSDDEL